MQSQFLFEDFKGNSPAFDNVPIKLQKNLISPSPNLLMEDDIVEEKLTTDDLSPTTTFHSPAQDVSLTVDSKTSELSKKDIYE